MGLLDGVRCAPSRRSLKFNAGPHAVHFPAFDASISREDRMTLVMLLFCCREELVDRQAVPGYEPPAYTPEELVEVRVVTDPRHPAFGQAGLYARKTIPCNQVVSPYSGFVEIFGASCNSRTYTMGFGGVSDDYALDAEFAGNYGRFANDPRGVEGLCANLCAEARYNSRGEAYTALVSRRQIVEGEEILMSYGKAHSLSASPWISGTGEALQRPRCGGVLAFPHVSAAPMPANTTPTAAPGRDRGTPDAAFDLFWECVQCGMWNHGSPVMLDVAYCTFCHSPKLSGAKLVAALTVPRVTKETLLREVGESQRLSDVRPGEGRAPPLLGSGSGGGSPTGRPHHHHLHPYPPPEQYDSVHVDWPMNIPFLPWQVWDAAVPFAVLARHCKFETHEHIFLYSVGGSSGGGERDDDDTTHSGGGGEDCAGGAVAHSRPASGHSAPTKRGRPPQLQPRAKRGKSHHDMWEKRQSEEELPRGGLTAAEPEELSSGSTVPLHSPPFVSGERWPQEETRSPTCPPSLARVFSLPSEVDRLIALATLRNPHGGADSGESLLQRVRRTLSAMTRRVFAGKHFAAGEVVAFVGGIVRLTEDTRCCPDNSPLSLPMKYLVPFSWRHRVLGAGACSTEESARALLRRLSSLTLVVTNELMHCPCFLAPDEDANAAEGKLEDADVTDASLGGAPTRSDVVRELLAECNVVLALAVDSLGSPHVALIATRAVEPFEPLLARMQ